MGWPLAVATWKNIFSATDHTHQAMTILFNCNKLIHMDVSDITGVVAISNMILRDMAQKDKPACSTFSFLLHLENYQPVKHTWLSIAALAELDKYLEA